jgi:hypothetical protein
VTASCAYTHSSPNSPTLVVTRFPVFDLQPVVIVAIGDGEWLLDDVGELFTGMDEEGVEVGLPESEGEVAGFVRGQG